MMIATLGAMDEVMGVVDDVAAGGAGAFVVVDGGSLLVSSE
jgi:hypothetical protein